VILQNLSPSTKYFYVYGSSDAESDMHSFTSAQTENVEMVQIIAFGDSGVADCEDVSGWCELPSGMTTNRIQEDMAVQQYDLLLHIGDISYAVGHAIRWEQFFHQIEPIATSIPYHVCIGNHEYDFDGQPFHPSWSDYGNDSHGECGVPFNSRFSMPATGNGNLWWSMDYGPAHFTFMSTEHNWTMGSDQWKWLKKDLSSVNRTATPWLIFAGHRPMYTGLLPTDTTVIMSKHMQQQLEPLLFQYKVDVALWGHVHNYERTCPVYQEQCYGDLDNPGATVHFVIGMAGQTLSTDWSRQPPVWSMFRASDYGYSRLIITPDTFRLQFVTTKDYMVHDDVSLHKNSSKKPF